MTQEGWCKKLAPVSRKLVVKNSVVDVGFWNIDYIREVRYMSHKIKAIKMKDNLMIETVFLDGTVMEYDVADMFALYPQIHRKSKKGK